MFQQGPAWATVQVEIIFLIFSLHRWIKFCTSESFIYFALFTMPGKIVVIIIIIIIKEQ